MQRPQSSLWCGLALSLALLAVLCGSAQAEFTPVAAWDHQLFPSFVIATAAIRVPEVEGDEEADAALLGDRQGVLGVKIESPADDTPVTVTITSDAIMEPSVFTGTLPAEGTTYTIMPAIKYLYRELAKNKQSVPVTVTFHVEIGDEAAEEQTQVITLRSVNDCPFTVVHGDAGHTDVSFVFAAYVNEQHPFVDKMLREALNGGIVNSFTGYQSKDSAEVYRQVYALWDALSKRDVRYSNITTSAATSDSVYSQHVRLIHESINNAQANCVDGSVLLASLLRKVDIEPALVFVPGHCYLAFYLDAEKTQLIGLETTLLGSSANKDAVSIAGCENVIDVSMQQNDSWNTFCAALAMGSKDLVDNQNKFGDKADPNYQVIPIAAARKIGILPIAFDADEQFEAAGQ